MQRDWAFLSIPKEELVEIHRALLTRYVVDSTLRREQGLEGIDYPPFLAHIEQLLSISEDRAHRLYHEIEDELWEYSWFDFTSEWAWHRAKQEVTKNHPEKMTEEAFEQLVDQQLEKHVDRYITEIDMDEDPSTKKEKRRARQSKTK